MPKKGGRSGNRGHRKAMRRYFNDMRYNEQLQKQTDFYFSAVAKHQGKCLIPDDKQLDYQEKQLFDSVTGTVGIDFKKYDNIPVQRSGKDEEKIPPMEGFADLTNIPPWLGRNIELCGYKMPTPVQKHAIPCGRTPYVRDIMCCAQTGSGKTAAFLLPAIADYVASPPDPRGRANPGVLVFAPTRELALQIFGEAKKFCHRSPMRACTVYGGQTIKTQLEELAMGCDILCATPGRLKDFVDRGVITLSKVRYLVLDEADRMLDMGFEPQIRCLVQERDCLQPPQRQTLMFSATFPKTIQKLAQDFMNNYIWISIGRVGSTTSSITQRVMSVRPDQKVSTLMQLFGEIHGPTLVFTRTKRTANRLYSTLRKCGISCATIHGDRSQTKRESALMAFRNGQVMALVATDVAGRGLDIHNVAHVINYDIPPDIDSYVHRIGRTARVGKRGTATSLFVPRGRDEQKIQEKLVQLLEESNQEVPQWLTWLAGGGKGKSRIGEQPSFGAMDARTNIKKRTVQSTNNHRCFSCNEAKPKSEFTTTQLKQTAAKRRCKLCISKSLLDQRPNQPKTQQSTKQLQSKTLNSTRDPPASVQALVGNNNKSTVGGIIYHICSVCGEKKSKDNFTRTQLSRPTAKRKCKICAASSSQPQQSQQSQKHVPTANGVTQHLPKQQLQCASCNKFLSAESFSKAQKNKSKAKRRCKLCVTGTGIQNDTLHSV